MFTYHKYLTCLYNLSRNPSSGLTKVSLTPKDKKGSEKGKNSERNNKNYYQFLC